MTQTAESHRIDSAFTYHPPHSDQAARYESIRAMARTFAHFLLETCPASRERTLAITKLEEAVMWANAAIARNEPSPRAIDSLFAVGREKAAKGEFLLPSE